MKEQSYGKGLTAKELQDIIDTAVIRRNKPTEYLLKTLKSSAAAVELIPEFESGQQKLLEKASGLV